MKLVTVRYAVVGLVGIGLASSAGSAQVIGGYSPVTDQRLESPEPGDWLTYRRTYDGWGYSPLDQIDTDNVGQLVPKWSFATDMPEGHEAPPIVNDGVMFITTPGAQVFALDARNGDLLWRYKRQLPDGLTQMHPTNRGVGLYGDRVFVTTVDAFLVAPPYGSLEATTRTSTSRTGEPGTPDPGWETPGPATTCTPTRSSRWTRTRAS